MAKSTQLGDVALEMAKCQSIMLSPTCIKTCHPHGAIIIVFGLLNGYMVMRFLGGDVGTHQLNTSRASKRLGASSTRLELRLLSSFSTR
jgi:hypothetical protein